MNTVAVLEAGQLTHKDLSDYDMGNIVIARYLGHSISKITGLVGCPWSSMVTTYQRFVQEVKQVNWQQDYGHTWLTDACEKQG